MKPVLRVLMVEDSEEDAQLVLRELKKSYEPKTVRLETREAMDRALEQQSWDIILSDFSMPRFSAPEAYEVLKNKGLDIPFIIVSGTVGEETAVNAMRFGAQDYLLKDKLTRLCPAIARELSDKAVRAARRQAEQSLRESESRYRALFDGNPLPTFVITSDEEQKILAVNEVVTQRYGYSREALLAMSMRQLQPAGLLEAGSVVQHRRADGSTLHAELHVHELDMGGRPSRVVVVNDVTERKKAEDALQATEAQLRQLQKMEAVGRLAGGVAHDFNNLLSVILTYTTTTIEAIAPDDPLREDLEEVKKAGERASDLTRQLLAFSRQQVIDPKILDLNAIIVDVEKMLRRVLRADIELTLRLAEGLGKIHADPTQVEQVLMNLVINARDAIPERGRITITTEAVTLDEAYAASHPGVTPGPYVLMAVTDTGVGMDAATQGRIFEPFFTTKEKGKGTGLGLATVYGIVTQTGGHMSVTSALGQGTTFRAYFPETKLAR